MAKIKKRGIFRLIIFILIILFSINLALAIDSSHQFQAYVQNSTGGAVPEILVKFVVPLPGGNCSSNATTQPNGMAITLASTFTYANGNSCYNSINIGDNTTAYTLNASSIFGTEGSDSTTVGDSQTQYIIQFSEPNFAPNLTGLPDQSTPEDTQPNWTIDLCNYTTDKEDNCSNFTYSISSQNTTLITCSIVSSHYFNCSQPGANLTGISNITVQVQDSGGLTDTDSFLINVIPVNDAPCFTLTNQTVIEGNTLIYNITASDVDTGDTLTYYDNSTEFNINPNTGLIDWSTSIGDLGIYSINITVCDDSGTTNNCTSKTFIINVTKANQPPIFNKTINNISWPEDTTTTLNLSQHFYDPDDDPITYYSTSPQNITIQINQTTGIVTFIPDGNFTGIKYIIFNATDSISGWSNFSNNVTLNVTPVNDPPTISDGSITELINNLRTLDLKNVLNYADCDSCFGDAHDFTLINELDPRNGTNFTITNSSSGDAEFISNLQGTYRYNISVTDSAGLNDTAILTVEVTNLNILIVKTIKAQSNKKYEVKDIIYNINNDSLDFNNLTLVDPDLGQNHSFPLDYLEHISFKANTTLSGKGIVNFSQAKIINHDLNSIHYSNQPSVYIKKCSGGGGGGGGTKIIYKNRTITVNVCYCGDGNCSEPFENCENCPEDCGVCPPPENTCNDFCKSLGYESGTCRQTKHDCFDHNEDWQEEGNKYCHEGSGGGGAGNCCCYPAEEEEPEKEEPKKIKKRGTLLVKNFNNIYDFSSFNFSPYLFFFSLPEKTPKEKVTLIKPDLRIYNLSRLNLTKHYFSYDLIIIKKTQKERLNTTEKNR